MNRPEAGDELLIAQFKDTGRTSFLDDLFARHMGMVRSMVYSMVLNDADADDLAQDIFIRAGKALGRFEGRSRFSTWLYRIAMNTTHRFLRTRSARPLDPLEHEDCPVPEHGHPDRSAMAGELDRAIADALDELAPALRAAIVLTVIQDVPVSDAARVEGCSTATMYWRVHRARKQLRAELGRYLS